MRILNVTEQGTVVLPNTVDILCNFCCRHLSKVRQMVMSAVENTDIVFICDGCVAKCAKLMERGG